MIDSYYVFDVYFNTHSFDISEKELNKKISLVNDKDLIINDNIIWKPQGFTDGHHVSGRIYIPKNKNELIGIVILNIPKSNKTDRYAVIKYGNKTLQSISIEKDDIYEFSFEDKVGFIEIKNNKVRMLPMDRSICPKSICSETGWINKSYQSIVCLPNKLIVTLEYEHKDKVDIISTY